MRVFVVIDSLAASGGAEQALAVTASGLVSAGVELTVQPVQDKPGIGPWLRDAGAVVLSPLGGHRFQQFRQLRRRIVATRPDLVHTTLFEADVLGRPAARAAGVPVVSSLVNEAYGPAQRRALPTAKIAAAQGLDLLTARLPVRFHAITEHVRNQVSRRLFIPRDKIDIIPRGRDPLVLGERSQERTRRVRQELGIPPDHVLIVSAARHEHQKGLDIAVQAVARVVAQQPRLSYAIAGRRGNDTSLLERIIRENTLDDVVTLLGSRSDVPDLIAAADVFLAPSRWEGLGSAIIEAMALHAPLVVSDVPAIRETVGGEDSALLVQPENVDALARAISTALANGCARQARAAAAYDRFNQHFTLSSVVRRTTDFYRRALAT